MSKHKTRHRDAVLSPEDLIAMLADAVGWREREALQALIEHSLRFENEAELPLPCVEVDIQCPSSGEGA